MSKDHSIPKSTVTSGKNWIFQTNFVSCNREIEKYSPLQLEPTFWGFPYKTPIHYVCRKLPKHYVKFPNFSSIACINVGSFSMSSGCKIFSGFGGSSCWNFNFRFSLLKLTFFVLSKLKVCNSRTTDNFGTKTHGEASYINASNWGKIGGFNINLGSFLS